MRYLELAEALISDQSDYLDDEARFRSAISRAYYSAFCLTRLKVTVEYNYRQTRKNSHQNLINFLRNFQDNMQLTKIRMDLGKIRDYRTEADYENHVENLLNKAKWTIIIAKRITQNL